MHLEATSSCRPRRPCARTRWSARPSFTVTPRLGAAAALGLALSIVPAARAGNWPQWRGPQGTGASSEAGLPVAWSEGSGIAWKVKLPGWGNSTPAIWGDAVLVTSQDGEDLLLVRVSKASGKIEWTRTVGKGATRVAMPRGKDDYKDRGSQKFHGTQNLASPSPVTDGEVVAVHYGNGDLAVYDLQGNVLWKRNLQEEHGKYTIWWGHANSPVLHGGLLISACIQDSLIDLGGDSPSYLVAHDVKTGKERWKTPRRTAAKSEACDAYTTPLLRTAAEGTELVVMGGNQLDAYDPATGKQLWRLPGLDGNRTITGPTLAHDLVFATIGMRGALVAVRPAGRGDLSRDAIVWRHEGATPDSPSPVPWGDLIFAVSDNGIASCLDARTGALRWKERLPGDYRASPLAADGRVYFLNTAGLTMVVAARDVFEKLSANALEDETIASPALSDGKLYLRGKKWLRCIGK